MKVRCEVVNGKKRIIIIKEASGVDKVKEAMQVVLGSNYEMTNK